MLVASVMFDPFCVMAMLLPAVNVAVPPGATLVTEVPLAVPVPVWAVVTFQPLFATALTALSWFMSTASVPLTPGAMLVTVRPPPLMPPVVRLGPLPPLVVTPVAVMVVPLAAGPTVTLLATLTLGARLKVTLLLAVVLLTAMLPSVLFRSTLVPVALFGPTLVALAPCALTFQPAPAIALTAFS